MTAGDRFGRLPLTYDECRARFRHAASAARLPLEAHAIKARGPDEQRLTLEVSRFGAEEPTRALLVLSGVHGVEGFVASTLQCDLIDRVEPAALPADVAVVLVHAVNPWGMAWWRRQNEHNVDLNRNWHRDQITPIQNDAYDQIHPLACPDTPELPRVDDLLVAATELVAERGVGWVRDAITTGQYRHPDGLHYGGEETEESNRILEQVITRHLGGVEQLFTVDLHTGHGPHGEITALCDAPPGSPLEVFLRAALPSAAVEPTTGNAEATTGLKSGQIAIGVAQLLPDAKCHATTLEVGTASDEQQLIATCQEQWVHRHGDRSVAGHGDPWVAGHGDPSVAEHEAVRWAYRRCFTPDDPDWERQARTRGAEQLDDALAAVVAWT